MDGPDGSVIVVSHILVKFLKRLRHLDKPRVLDLGYLSGSNIEFFATRGCRVQVEDLIRSMEPVEPPCPSVPTDAPPDGGVPRDALPSRAGDPVVAFTPAPAAPPEARTRILPPGAPPPDGPVRLTDAPAAPAALSSPGRPGSPRPSRRIVLPPRTFRAPEPPLGRTPQARDGGLAPSAAVARARALSPAALAYADEAFDAVIGWDMFNYCDAPGLERLAGEMRRVLAPGGLLLGFFHARRPDGLESPRRYRILDEARLACSEDRDRRLPRFVYQNRDIEKMFAGLSIVEHYFLKNATRELLMEKKSARPSARPPVRAVVPKPRFTIE